MQPFRVGNGLLEAKDTGKELCDVCFSLLSKEQKNKVVCVWSSGTE